MTPESGPIALIDRLLETMAQMREIERRRYWMARIEAETKGEASED